MTKRKRRMEPREYKAVKEALGWSHERLGNAIGVTERTPYRYASGDVEIQEPTARLMRLLVLLKMTMSQRKFDEVLQQLHHKVT